MVYDLTTNQAFNLNETTTIIYKACDGETMFAELKRKHKFTGDFIYLALDESMSHNLLADDRTPYQSPFVVINRRDVIKKVGFASMFVLPIIAGIVWEYFIDYKLAPMRIDVSFLEIKFSDERFIDAHLAGQ